jgi:two-component sensor histidine kinase
LPPDFQLVTPRTLGLRLVRALVAQLRAELRVDGTAGTRFTLTLPTPKKEPCA